MHTRKVEDLSRDELIDIVNAALNLVGHHPGFSADEWYAAADDHGDAVSEHLIPALVRAGL